MKRFQVIVVGTVYFQVSAEDEEMATAIIQTATSGGKVQFDILENELNAIKAIEKLTDPELNMYEVPET